MHSLVITEDLVILYHGDYNGDATIRQHSTKTELNVPMDALRQLVAREVRSEQIGKLESATTEELLGLPRRPVPGEQHINMFPSQ